MFALTRLLAILPMGNFLRGPLGKLLLTIGVVVLVIGGFKWWLYSHDKAIQEAALTNFNNAQLDQAIKDRIAFDRSMEQVISDQKQRIANLSDARDSLSASNDSIINGITSGDFVDRPASGILKEAVTALSQRGVNQP